MPLWRCPHCGTPQAEAARCWVCRRSTTSCATCRHFRRGVTAQFGYCGLDRGRLALRGDEMRACWAAAPAQVDATDSCVPVSTGSLPHGSPRRTFVPVEDAPARAAAAGGGLSTPVPVVSASPAPDAPRWSLWGDAESPL